MPDRAQRHSPKRARANDCRPTAAQRGYGSAWQRYRDWYLSQPGHVLCAECQREPATVVDHKQPHKGDTHLFWEPSNHQPLCEGCHNRKTATRDGGFGRPRG